MIEAFGFFRHFIAKSLEHVVHTLNKGFQFFIVIGLPVAAQKVVEINVEYHTGVFAERWTNQFARCCGFGMRVGERIDEVVQCDTRLNLIGVVLHLPTFDTISDKIAADDLCIRTGQVNVCEEIHDTAGTHHAPLVKFCDGHWGNGVSFAKITMANKRTLYWTAQVSGWLTYVVILALWSLFTSQFEWPIVKVWATVFFTGVIVSHLLRSIIIYLGWLSLTLYSAIWRLFFTALILGFVAALLHAVVSDLFFAEIRPLLVWPFGELMQVVLAYAPELLIWSLIYFAWNYFRNFEREEIKNLRLEASKNEIELNNLKSQLNPHFMFNAMNSIRALVDENPELAKRSITQLSMILRNTLVVGKHQFIPLEEELQVVRNYLDLEGIRYEERLQVSYDIDPDVLNQAVPPLMIQTLVENAVKHGISKLVKGGRIAISARKTDHGYTISVRNTGHFNGENSSLTGIGLSNTRKRLALLFKGDADFDIYREGNEVVAIIVFPKQQQK